MKRKLSDSQIKEIRVRAKTELHRVLAKEYNVQRTTISAIVSNRYRKKETDNYKRSGSPLYD
jgi:hypothetical protein